MRVQPTAGILFRRENRWLLIERKKRPFGLGLPAGHVEKGESVKDAAIREAKEEIYGKRFEINPELLKPLATIAYNADYQQQRTSPWKVRGKSHVHRVHVFLYESNIPEHLKGRSDARNPKFYSPRQLMVLRKRLTPAPQVALAKVGAIPGTSAVIFDHDGTLVEMFEAHLLAFQTVFKKMGLDFSRADLEARYGQTSYDAIKSVLKERGWRLKEEELERVTREKQRLYRVFAAKKIKLLPGVLRLLRALRIRGYRIAIASSGARKSIELTLRTTKLKNFFDTVVTTEDVKRGKPYPDLFLEAAGRLGVRPTDCVVIEDSPHGIEAARCANMHTIAVATGPASLVDLLHSNPTWAVPNLVRTSQILRWL